MHPIADDWQTGFLFFLRFLAFANILLVYLFNSFKFFNTFSRQKTFAYQSLKSIHVNLNRKTSEKKREGPWVNTGKRVCCNGLMREWIHDSGFWKGPRGRSPLKMWRTPNFQDVRSEDLLVICELLQELCVSIKAIEEPDWRHSRELLQETQFKSKIKDTWKDRFTYGPVCSKVASWTPRSSLKM